MLTREFGSTGVQVPLIGQGTWKIESDGAEALRLGIELGMTHIDTAEMYSGAEAVVAKAIEGQREKVFLVSKVLPSNASYKGTLSACEASLRRLKTDYLDVYLLHWWSGSHPIEETMRAMEDLVAAGKARFIGVSNFDLGQIKKAQHGLARHKIACDQVLYHMNSRGIEYRLVPYCAENKIAVVAYTPFGAGIFPSGRTKQGQVLAAIAARHGKTPRQVALNFLTRRRNVFTIPKAAKLDHIRENAGAVGWELDAEDLRQINAAFPPPYKEEPLDMV
ncbi:MAG: aldo/keto reductase [Acidobacteria bacterium]|nr:aldo/keto reductase [Acidobacteriota bacterium]